LFPIDYIFVQALSAEISPMYRPHRLTMHRLAPNPGNPVQHKLVPTSPPLEQLSGQIVAGVFARLMATATTSIKTNGSPSTEELDVPACTLALERSKIG
jgi:hypothetical protein